MTNYEAIKQDGQIRKLEKRIIKLEEGLKNLTELLEDPLVYGNTAAYWHDEYEDLRKSLQKIKDALD